MTLTKKEVMLAEMILAERDGHAFVIAVNNGQTISSELIINPTENLEYKRNYYSNAYTDDLTLVHNEEIGIEWFSQMNNMLYKDISAQYQ